MDSTRPGGVMSEGTKKQGVQRDVAREQYQLLAENVHASNLPTLLVGVLLSGFYTHFADLWLAWAWFAVLMLVVAVRWALLRGAAKTRRPLPSAPAASDITDITDLRAASKRQQESNQSEGAAGDSAVPSRAPIYIMLGITGLLWGAAPLLVVWQVNELAVLPAMLLAAGIAIAAFGSYGIDARATGVVTIPIGAAILMVAALSSNPAYYTVAVALPLLYAHQFFVMSRNSRVLENQIRLRLENAVLIAELSEHAEKTSAELDRRMDTERMLRASRDRAERMSATDALTEISNRRYFDKRLKSEVSRAFRERTNLSLVICDIDFFKQFNDLYGHQKGDECLKAFARVLESYCRRGGDIAARIGGEEFALLLPNTEHGAALKLADQSRAAFDGMAVPHAGSKITDHTTASFGVSTTMPDDLEAGEALLRRADQALYLAKERGRNQVVSETDLPDEDGDKKAPEAAADAG